MKRPSIRFTLGDTNFLLTADDYQFILKEVRTYIEGEHAGEEYFPVIGYSKHPHQLLARASEYSQYCLDVTTFEELSKRTSEILDEIRKIRIAYEDALKGAIGSD